MSKPLVAKAIANQNFDRRVKCPCIPDEFWRCACGNDLYYLTEQGCVCRECGTVARDVFL